VMARVAPISPTGALGFELPWQARNDGFLREASPEGLRQLRSPVLLAPVLPPAPLATAAVPPAFFAGPHPGAPGMGVGLSVAAVPPLPVAAATAIAPAQTVVPVSVAAAPPVVGSTVVAAASQSACSMQPPPPSLHFASAGTPQQPQQASRSGACTARSCTMGTGEAEAHGSHQPPDTLPDDCHNRRPTDPFFYPTTLNPLTSRGLGLIEQSTPPKVKAPTTGTVSPSGPSICDGFPAREESMVPLCAPAPEVAFGGSQSDELRLLQQQNDTLARHIQALEHAKSLAAVQSAQALHKIRTRQEQLKRESQQASQRAMQSDFSPPPSGTPPGPLLGVESPLKRDPLPGFERVDAVASLPQPPHQPPPTALEGGAYAAHHSPSVFFHERGGLSSPGRSTPSGPAPGANVAQQPLWSQEAWQSPQPPSARGLATAPGADLGLPDSAELGLRPPQHRLAHPQSARDGREIPGRHTTEEDARTLHGTPGDMRPPLPGSVAEQSASLPMLPCLGALGPQQDSSAGTVSGRRPDVSYVPAVGAMDGQAAMLPWLATMQQTPAAVDALPAPLPAADVPPTDIATMASRILTAHHAPGHSGVSTLPNGQPYVDALGNPLGPITGPELPNIKDDAALATPSAASLSNADRLSLAPEAADVGSVVQVTLQQREAEASAQPELAPPQPLVSARGSSLAHERVSVAVAHERAPTSARGSNAAVAAGPERQDRRSGQRSEGAVAGGSSSSRARGSSLAGRGGAADSRGVGSGDGGMAASGNRLASDAADAAAGSAATPPSTPAAEGSQRASRVRQESPESLASRAGRRRSSDEASPGQQSPPPPEQSEELQAELEECLDTIKWCASSVTRESLQDLKNTSKPAPVVKDVLEAVTVLLGQPESRWDRLRKLISSTGFVERVQKLNFQQAVTREQFKKLRERLANPDFDEELIKTVCVPVVPLATWCRAIGVYLSKTKFRGGPEIRPVAGAGAASPPQHQGDRRPVVGGTYMNFDPDLDRLEPEELRRVRELTISRPAVGKITFHGETDCTGLDFDRIVRLEIGEVLVYPESGTKPPVGVGLNKAATVTMYQCWPPNGSKLLQDVKGQERYKKKIQQMTEEKQAKFIDYDCTTGIWKFSVDHF